MPTGSKSVVYFQITYKMSKRTACDESFEDSKRPKTLPEEENLVVVIDKWDYLMTPLKMIMHLLPAGSILNFSMTCKRFRSFIFQTELIQLLKFKFPFQEEPSFYQRITTFNASYQTKVPKNVQNLTYRFPKPCKDKLLVNELSNLKTLTLVGSGMTIPVTKLSALPEGLEELVIKESTIKLDKVALPSTLKRLTIMPCDLARLSKPLPLEYLKVIGGDIANSFCKPNLHTVVTGLKELDMHLFSLGQISIPSTVEKLTISEPLEERSAVVKIILFLSILHDGLKHLEIVTVGQKFWSDYIFNNSEHAYTVQYVDMYDGNRVLKTINPSS